MKRYILPIALAVALAGGSMTTASASGIPVIDVAKIANDTANQAANIAKYVQMIQQYQTQIDQMRSQYESLTGSRGLGNILNNPEFSNYLPADWQNVYRQVSNGGYSGLSGSARALVDAAGLLNACENRLGDARIACERDIAKTAQDKSNVLDAFDAASARWTQIQGLIQQINATTDPKAIAELQARINGEQAAIHNEQTKLQMFQMLAQVEERVQQQQRRAATQKEVGQRGWTEVRPLTAGGN